MNESTRKIVLTVSREAILPENIETLSLEDTFYMLEMGYFSIQHVKKEIYSQKNSEKMEKMKQELSDEYEKTIQQLKNQISEGEILSNIFKNQFETNVSERLKIQSAVYDSMLEKMKHENDQLREKMAGFEKEKGSISQQQIQMMDKIVNEKELRVAQREKEVELIKSTVEKYGELVDHLTKKKSTI
jgi:pyruvoyl-dependent arginine decarboxylase (PvlArgDC)